MSSLIMRMLTDFGHSKSDRIFEHFKFQSFKGYDAAGFFKLGKPLLVGIFANFITYLIVLIQFNSSTTTNEKIPDEINLL